MIRDDIDQHVLTEVTEEIRAAWDLPIRLLPMSDDRRTTIVTTADHGDASFQAYLVRLPHHVATTSVRSQAHAPLT